MIKKQQSSEKRRFLSSKVEFICSVGQISQAIWFSLYIVKKVVKALKVPFDRNFGGGCNDLDDRRERDAGDWKMDPDTDFW